MSSDTVSYTIGIDFGGVLSEHDGGDAEHRTTVINMDGAIEAVTKLKNEIKHALAIISFCGFSRARDTKKSMDESGLSKLFDAQFYVKKREDKKYICNYLGCDFMIDDREFILDDVKTLNPGAVTILFGGDKGPNQKHHLWAPNWEEVLRLVSEHSGPKVVANPLQPISVYCHSV